MKYHQGIHLESQFDKVACLAVTFNEVHVADIVDLHFTEKIQVGGHITLVHSVLGHFDKKAVVPIQIPVIVKVLVIVFTPFFSYALAIAIATNRIMPTDTVIGD